MTAGFGFCKRSFVGLLALGLLACSVSTRAQEIRWFPITASGNVACLPGDPACTAICDPLDSTCLEREIVLSAGGVQVTLFIEASEWDNISGGHPGDTHWYLGGVQGTLQSSSLAGGIVDNPGTIAGDDLEPVGFTAGNGFRGAFQALKACGDMDCVINGNTDPSCDWLPLTDCGTNPDSGSCPGTHPACIDRPDYVFNALANTNTVSTAAPDFTWLSSSTDGKENPRLPDEDPEQRFYVGTLLVNVPALAEGSYNVKFVDDVNFTVFNTLPGPVIPGLVLGDGRITIVRGCCLPDGLCDFRTGSNCSGAGGIPVPVCLGDGDSNGTDDICEADCNSDGTPDIRETDPAEQDCDLDGTCNGTEIKNCSPEDSSCADCNTNGIPDECDLADRTSDDCNDNGIPDECDIANGPSVDTNGNGVPDECDPGACCYYSQGYPVCQELRQAWCVGVFQGLGTACPGENIYTAGHGSGPFSHLTDPVQECPEGIRGRADCIPGDPIDPWSTAAGALMCHLFGVEGSPPIPADFFGPGSDPYGTPAFQQVCLEGEPLGPISLPGYPDPLEFGQADTLVRRSGDPFDRCELPSPTEATIQTELVALSLRSTAPITVTYDGETDCAANPQNCEEWDVKVDLSMIEPPPGVITAVKTHCNGGTYASELHVQPRFTFTKVADPPDPGEVRVLDTGAEGIPYVTLVQDDDPPWTSDVSWNLGLTSEICTDFHPAIEDPQRTQDCDCNDNAVRDECDIEEDVSQDCNDNATPDECELVGNDCNGNTIPDECEGDCQPNGVPDDCDITDGISADCQPNGIPDECDIATGTSQDLNGNGIPDECEIPTGACCLRDGRCVDSMAESDCVDVGTYQGDGIACATLPDSDGDGVVDCIDQCPGLDDDIYAPGCKDAIPTLSHWGLIVLTLLLLAAGKIYFGRRRAAKA